jgi:hypothetical protein
MKVIQILAVLCFAAFAAATTTYGVNSFYATYLLTNAEYGAGAVFGGRVWLVYKKYNKIKYNNNNFLNNKGSMIKEQVLISEQ